MKTNMKNQLTIFKYETNLTTRHKTLFKQKTFNTIDI